jgi:hypothetical protein
MPKVCLLHLCIYFVCKNLFINFLSEEFRIHFLRENLHFLSRVATIRYVIFSSCEIPMELSVRAYIFDEDERVLMVRHSPDQPWVLPGGHVEE